MKGRPKNLYRSNLYRKDAIAIAQDLCYGDKVVERIKRAKNNNEITRILTEARKGR